jgi:3-hydroxyisobutyrate dehydrogenase-like beta-hydroxyacid dehydrogenase
MQQPKAGSEIVAIVGTGEMGTAIGRRLREYGARVRTSLRDRSAASARRVEDAGLEICNDDRALIADAGFLFSIVPPSQAAAVAERFLDPLKASQKKPVFVECNAIAPVTARGIAARLWESGCEFIDAGIIGGPPPARRSPEARRTTVYASGKSAPLLERLSACGLDVELLDDRIGSASALKMCYAGLTKGLIALGAVMIRASARSGLAGALSRELALSQREMLKLLARRVPNMLPKAYRWIGEMDEIANFLEDDAAGASIFHGAAKLYSLLADEMAGRTGSERRDVAQLLSFFVSIAEDEGPKR